MPHLVLDKGPAQDLTRAQMRALYKMANQEAGPANLDLGHAPLNSLKLDARGMDSTEASMKLGKMAGTMRDLLGIRDDQPATSEANAAVLPQPEGRAIMRVTNFFLRRRDLVMSAKEAAAAFPSTESLCNTDTLEAAFAKYQAKRDAWFETRKMPGTEWCVGMMLGHLENGAHVAIIQGYRPRVRIVLEGVLQDEKKRWKRILAGAKSKVTYLAKVQDEEDMRWSHAWMYTSQTFKEDPVLVLDAYVPGIKHAQWLYLNLLRMEILKEDCQLRVPRKDEPTRWTAEYVALTVQETQLRQALDVGEGGFDSKALFRRIFSERTEELLQDEAFHHLTSSIPTKDRKGVAPYHFISFPVKTVRITGLRCPSTVAEFEIQGGWSSIQAIPTDNKDVQAWNTPILLWDIETHSAANYGKNTAQCKPLRPEDWDFEGGEEKWKEVHALCKPQVESMRRNGMLRDEELEEVDVDEDMGIVDEDEGEGGEEEGEEEGGGGGGGGDVFTSDGVTPIMCDAKNVGDRAFMVGMVLGWTSNVSPEFKAAYLAHPGLGAGDEARTGVACGLHQTFLRYIFTLQDCAPIRGAVVVVCEDEAQMLDLCRDVQTVLWQPHISTHWNGWKFDEPYMHTRSHIVGTNRWRYQRAWSDTCWGKDIIRRKLESSAVGKDDPNYTNVETGLQIDLIHYDKNIRAGGKRESNGLQFVSKSEKLIARNAKVLGDDGKPIKDLKAKEAAMRAVKMDGKLEVEYWMLDVLANWDQGEPDVDMVAAAATYCLMDCVLCMLYVKQTGAGIHLIGMSQNMFTHCSTGMTLQQKKVKNNLMRTHQADERVMENMYSKKHSAPHSGCYKGGTVLNPFPALYALIVLMMDFASLYPSLIRMRNLCYSTFLSTTKQINGALTKGYPVFQVHGSMKMWSFLQKLPRWWAVARLGEAVQRLRHLVMAVYTVQVYVILRTSPWKRKIVYTRRNHLTREYEVEEWVAMGVSREQAVRRANAILKRSATSSKRPLLSWEQLAAREGVVAQKMTWRAGYGWNVDYDGLEYVQLDDWSTYVKAWTDPLMRLEYLMKRVASPDAAFVASDPSDLSEIPGHGIATPPAMGLTITETDEYAVNGIPLVYRADNNQIPLLQLDGIPLCGDFKGTRPLTPHPELSIWELRELHKAVYKWECCDEMMNVRVPGHEDKWRDKEMAVMSVEQQARFRAFMERDKAKGKGKGKGKAGGGGGGGLVEWLMAPPKPKQKPRVVGSKSKATTSPESTDKSGKKQKTEHTLKHLPCVTDTGTHMLARALLSTLGPGHHAELCRMGSWIVWDHASHGKVRDCNTPQRPGRKALDGTWMAVRGSSKERAQSKVEKLLRTNIACPMDYDMHAQTPPEGSHVIVAGNYESHPDITVHTKKGKWQLNVGVPLPALCSTRGLEGCLPKSERELLQDRNKEKALKAKAKADGDDAAVKRHDSNQLCAKILMNSMYGFLGAVFSFYGCVAVADSICAVGGQCLRGVAWVVENEFARFGSHVVYGDTDSVMFTLKELASDPARLMRVGYIIETVLTALSNFPMNMEFEAAYGRFLPRLSKIYGGLKMASSGSGPLDIEDMCARAVALEAKSEEDMITTTKQYVSPLAGGQLRDVYSICIKGAKPVRRDASAFTKVIMSTVYKTLLTSGDLRYTMSQLFMYLRLLSEDRFTAHNAALVGSGKLRVEEYDLAFEDGRLENKPSEIPMFVYYKSVRPDDAYAPGSAPNEAITSGWEDESIQPGSRASGRTGLVKTHTVNVSCYDPPSHLKELAANFKKPASPFIMQSRAKQKNKHNPKSKSKVSIPGCKYKDFRNPAITRSERRMYEELGKHRINRRSYLWMELYNSVRDVLMCVDDVVLRIFLEADRAIQSYDLSQGWQTHTFVKNGEPTKPPPEAKWTRVRTTDFDGKPFRFIPMRMQSLDTVSNDLIVTYGVPIPLHHDVYGNARDTRFDQS